MADNFLEQRWQDYEKRKAEWLKSKHRLSNSHTTNRQNGKKEE